mmetsp:Transcript_23890/g.18238  ORF Transcript_23890/g.18238 Transcript_23890/m.18238 type:complete len:85 (+) Transcript_23890:3-257(+)
MIYIVVANYVREDYFDEGDKYPWVIAFFLAQIFGFLGTSVLGLFLAGAATFYCNCKRCPVLFWREILIINEDYRYVHDKVKRKD